MRATLQNSGQTASLALFFAIIITSLTNSLPGAMTTALTNAGASQLAQAFNSIPPTGALFAAFLGYNPVGSVLSSSQLAPIVRQLPQSTVSTLTSTTFFPNAIAPAFMSALQVSFFIGAALSFGAGVASLLRGQRYIYEVEQARKAAGVEVKVPIPSIRSSNIGGEDPSGGTEEGNFGKSTQETSSEDAGLADPHGAPTPDQDGDAEKEDNQ
jgi:hypothetical protein